MQVSALTLANYDHQAKKVPAQHICGIWTKSWRARLSPTKMKMKMQAWKKLRRGRFLRRRVGRGRVVGVAKEQQEELKGIS